KSVIAFTQKFCFHVGPPIVKLETYTYIAELQAFLTEFYRSTQANCVGNMKQIGAALVMYLDDYNGYLVSWGCSWEDNFAKALAPYLNVKKRGGVSWTECSDIYMCKSAEHYIYDYGTNVWTGYTNSSMRYKRITQITRPTQIVFAAELKNVVSFNTTDSFDPRHSGRGICVFMDAHVEAKKRLESSNLY
ncbi:MAG: hypothetical protein PHH77_11925, partial [Victivallaceae bacterium]|nr:hypothetical protein [Victivallaceae bacterium]